MNLSKSINPKVRNSLLLIASVLVPFLLFVGVLQSSLPIWILEAFRFNFWGVGIAVLIGLFLALRCPGYWGRILSLILVSLIFALPLATLWQTGMSVPYVLAGLLPISDAAGYYADAHTIMNGGNMGDWGPQRPLFPGFLAVLLALTHRHLQATIVILVLINAIACFFTAREVQKVYGAIAAALFTLQVWFFYRPFIGTVLTENLGLPLGLLGFAALLRGAHQRQMKICLAGILFLAFALNARVGTIFVLPALVLWGSLIFRRSARFSWKFLLGSCAMSLLAYILNSTLLKVVSPPNAAPGFSNFSLTLYGIITQTSWDRIFVDYPEVWALSAPERSKKAYELTIELIRQDPGRIVSGVLRGWREFFFGNSSYISWNQSMSDTHEWILRWFSVVGLLGCLRHWKSSTNSLILALSMGVFFSIPFVPIWDAGIRPYAATIAVIYITSALGFMILMQDILRPLIKGLSAGQVGSLKANVISWTKFRSLVEAPLQQQDPFPQTKPSALLSFGFILMLLSFAAPLIINLTATSFQAARITCPDGLEARVVQFNPGSAINIVGNQTIRQSRLPNIRIKDLRKGLRDYGYWPRPEPGVLKEVKRNTTILDTSGYWLVADTSKVPVNATRLETCGTLGTLRNGPNFFYVKSLYAQ